MGSAEPWQDFDWRNELVLSTRKQIERFYNTVMEIKDAAGEPHDIDRWLASRLQAHIARTTEGARQLPDPAGPAGGLLRDRDRPEVVPPPAPEGLRRQQGTPHPLLGLGPAPCPVHPVHRGAPLEGTGGGRARLLRPVAGCGSNSWSTQKAELAEELLARTVEDIESIQKLIQLTPKAITIALAPEWKQEIFRTIAVASDRNTVVKEIMKDPAMRKRGKEATDAARQITTLIHRLPPYVVEPLVREPISEQDVFESAKAFLEQEFGVPVHITGAGGERACQGCDGAAVQAGDYY